MKKSNFYKQLKLITVLLFGIFLLQNCTKPTPADIDKDGIINSNDLNLLLNMYGDSCIACPEDINNDSVVNSLDYAEVIGNFGKTVKELKKLNKE